MINEHNATESNFKLGHNQFTDWFWHEYRKMTGYTNPWNVDKLPLKIVHVEKPHDYVNWVEAGAITPVKDQGHCGADWAFTVTGGLEAAHFLATTELLTFSEQQLIDCAVNI